MSLTEFLIALAVLLGTGMGSLALWILNDMRTSMRDLGGALKTQGQEIVEIDKRVVRLEEHRGHG